MSKQLTVFIENKKGSLVELTKILNDKNININSFSLADTENYGVMRMVVDQPEKALEALKDSCISASLTDITIVEIENRPGALYELLDLVDEFNVEYIYMYSNSKERPGVVLKIRNKEEAEKILKENNFKFIR